MIASAARWRSDRGVATVITCAAISGLLVVIILVVHVGAGVATRHRAQAAADLAALAAAGALDRGVDSACAIASGLVDRMRVQLRRCAPDGWDIVLEVAAPVSLGPFGTKHFRAVARAGPVAE